MVLLDDHGRVIRDALLWNDTRSATNADVLIACLGEAEKAADGSEDDLSDDPGDARPPALGQGPSAPRWSPR